MTIRNIDNLILAVITIPGGNELKSFKSQQFYISTKVGREIKMRCSNKNKTYDRQEMKKIRLMTWAHCVVVRIGSTVISVTVQKLFYVRPHQN